MNRELNVQNKTTANRLRCLIPDILFIVLGVVIDQATKYLTVIHLKDQKPFIILDGIFELRYLENRGAAFGLLQNQQLFFMISVILITGVAFVFYIRVPLERKFAFLRFCAAAILVGGFGNCIDRLRQGFVVDFFYFKLIDFPIFNVADIYVTVATVLLIVLLLFYYKEEDLERIFYGGKRERRTD